MAKKKQTARVQISRKRLVTWSVFFLFVALWMFVLGVMVGRGIVPLDMEKGSVGRELATLKAKMVQKQAGVGKQVEGRSAEKPHFDFYEELKAPREAKRLKVPAPKPVAKTAAKPAPAVAPPKAVAPDKGRFAVQVAAVRDIQSAERLVAKLRKKGYPAYQTSGAGGGKKVWYRIRVGAFENRDAAGTTLQKLQREGYGAIVVTTR